MSGCFNFFKKYWQLLLGCLAVAIVVIGFNDVILPPNRELSLISPTSSVQTEDAFVVVDKYHERLIFANKDSEIVRVLEVDSRELPFDKVYDVYSVDDHIFVLASVAKEKSILLCKEVLAEYSPEGKYLGNRHQVEYAVAENLVHPGFQYLEKSDDGMLLTSFRGNEIKFDEITNQGVRTLASKKLDFVPLLSYRVDEMECLIQGVDGWYRFYDGKKNTLTLLDKIGTPYEDFILETRQLPIKLALSQKLLLKTYVFWGSVAILVILGLRWLIFGVIILCRSAKAFRQFALGFGAVVLAAVIAGFYTFHVYKATIKHYSTVAEVECRIAYNDLIIHHSYLFDLLKKKDINDILGNYSESCAIQNYAANILRIVTTNGPTEAFSGSLLVKDKEGRVRIMADTTLDETDGTVYWDLDEMGKGFKDKPDIFVAEDEGFNGKYLTCFHKLYRDDGTCFGFLSLDVNMKKIDSQQKTIALRVFMDLLGIMIALYILFDIAGQATLELKQTLKKYREKAKFVGAELSGSCTFFGGLPLCFDDVLWIFAVNEICSNSMDDFIMLIGTIMMGIATGRFFSSAILPKLRVFYADRVLVTVGILGAAVGYFLCLMSFAGKNSWFYVVGLVMVHIFGVGLYKPLLLRIALQHPDSDKRGKAVDKYYSNYAMASAAGALCGVMLYRFFGFTVLYGFIVSLFLLVAPMIIICSSGREMQLQEHVTFNFRKMWDIFANFDGMSFLLLFSFPLKIFLLFVFGIFGSIFAKAGVDANLVTYFMIYGYILNAVFPGGKIAEKIGSSITAIICLSLLDFGLLLSFWNNSMAWLVFLYILMIAMEPEGLRDNILLMLSEKKGYDQKVTSDSYLFVENIVGVIFSWLLGFLLVYDEKMICGITGVSVMIMMCIGWFFIWWRKRNGIYTNL